MDGLKLQSGTDITGALNKGILLLEIVMNGQVLGGERQLGLGDLALVVVLEGELEFGEVVKELARDLVEENEAVAVELGGDTESGSLEIGESRWWRWRWKILGWGWWE